MFTEQSPQIATALWQGGLSAQSANAVQNLIGQCRAPLVHRGPLTIDYTRQDMRLITPEIYNYYFPPGGGGGLPGPIEPGGVPPQRPEEPPWQGQPWQPPEHEPPVIINEGPTIINNFGGGQTGIQPGPYIEVQGNQVSLKNKDKQLHCVFKDGFVDSKDFKAKNTDISRPYVSLDIREQATETEWELKVGRIESLSIITNVELTPENELKFERSTGYVFFPQEEPSIYLETTPCEDPPASP